MTSGDPGRDAALGFGSPPDQGDSIVPAVTRAVAIIDLLATHGTTLGLSVIARQLRLPKSSVANICATLVDSGLLRVRNGGFALGQRLAQFGAAYLAGVDQVGMFQESCALLTAGRNDTAQIAMLSDGLDVIYLAKREGLYAVRLASTPGRSLPATCTATGKAMLSMLDEEELHARLAQSGPLPQLTSRSITSIPRLEDELAKIRHRGYAVDQEEVIEGVVCIAVAIPRPSRTDQLLAVSITLLKPRATKDLLGILAKELRDVTDAIALGLGVPIGREPGSG